MEEEKEGREEGPRRRGRKRPRDAGGRGGIPMCAVDNPEDAV